MNSLDLFPEVAPAPPAAAKTFGSAKFSFERTCRNEIRRWWVEKPTRWVAWLMLNPSDAGEKKNDPTALRVTHFTRAWGFDGWIGVNVYPLISSTQLEMWRWVDWENNGPDWYARDAIHHNVEFIEAAGREASLRMAAFGAQPSERDDGWLEECLEAFQQPSNVGAGEMLHCLGTNKTGQPLHPMARGKWRVPDDRRPILWREA